MLEVLPSTWKTFKLRQLTKWRAAVESRSEANCKLLTWYCARENSYNSVAGAWTRPDRYPLLTSFFFFPPVEAPGMRS